MEKFDRDIFPVIEDVLRNTDLGNEDLYLRLYMIGKNRSKSRPVIMVCCSNPRVRAQAESSIRASSVPDTYPEFALGACAIPLEQPGVVRGLTSRAGKAPVIGRSEDGKNANSSFNPTSIRPIGSLGGRIVVKHLSRRLLATGGAALHIPKLSNLGYYQITVSHVFHPEPILEAHQHDLDECHFDGMDEVDEDDESEDDMKAESKTPNCEADIATGDHFEVEDPGSPLITSNDLDYALGASFENAVLDYALLFIELVQRISIPPNEITMPQGSSNRTIRIQEVASIPAKEHRIVLVTASSGVIHGVLVPSVVYFRNGALSQVQKLYPVQLQSPLFEGDSGSVVVDPTPGHLFGHLVRGVPGSTVGYVVAATEVFESIQRDVGLADVQLVKQDTPNEQYDSKEPSIMYGKGHSNAVSGFIASDFTSKRTSFRNFPLTPLAGPRLQHPLVKNADVNVKGGKYDNGLSIASGEGNITVVQLLLDKGAYVNTRGGHYGNALQAASHGGHKDIVQLLLDKGAYVNAQGGHYSNALQAASHGGHKDIVQLLLDKGAYVNTRGGHYGNALQAASHGGHKDIVQLLLDKGAYVNTWGGHYGNALQAASHGGHYGNALQAASHGGHKDIVQLLLDKGAYVNTRGGHYGNALQAASCMDHGDIVQLLLNKGADVNAKGGYYGNALQAASCMGHGDIVQLLLNKGADVNAKGGYYGNALQAASNRGHKEIVQLLLGKDADMTSRMATTEMTSKLPWHGAPTARRIGALVYDAQSVSEQSNTSDPTSDIDSHTLESSYTSTSNTTMTSIDDVPPHMNPITGSAAKGRGI